AGACGTTGGSRATGRGGANSLGAWVHGRGGYRRLGRAAPLSLSTPRACGRYQDPLPGGNGVCRRTPGYQSEPAKLHPGGRRGVQLPRGGDVMPGVARSVPSPPAVAPPAGGNPPAGAPIAMPAGAGLAAGKAPPFRLPGEHFTAALCFLALGTAGIVVAAPELASGAYLSPRVTAITHLFTLGWITT